MSLELTLNNHNQLVDQIILDKSVLGGRCLPLAFLQEFSTTNGHIPTVLNKDAIGLDKLLVVQEEVRLVAVANGADDTSLRPREYLDHIVEGKCAIPMVVRTQRAISEWLGDLLAKVTDLVIDYLALLIDHLEVVFLDLEYQASILVSIVLHKVTCFKAMARTSCHLDPIMAHQLVGIRLKLEKIGQVLDLLLTLVEF